MGEPRDRAGEAVYGCTLGKVAEPDTVLLPGHDVPLGRYTVVRRLLPQRQRRMIGAWCFVDHFGPQDVRDRPGMQVPPHPHTGLQTVTWLVQGEIVHRDSLGNQQAITPGQLNLMSSGRGIAHSEESPTQHPPEMHGLQLWVALPDGARAGAPRFDHHPELPVLRDASAAITVVVGMIDSVRSPAPVHSPLVGAEVRLGSSARLTLPLEREFEHGVLVLTGAAEVDGAALAPGALLYLGRGRPHMTVRATGPARLFLIGGEPFDEPLVMWWNFVARSHEEIVAARDAWMMGARRFGTVPDSVHAPLPAPEMPTVRLKARNRHGQLVD